MNLREQYETLLRRGMPELCELEWRENGMYGPWTMGLWADDAESDIVRDLITMHALRNLDKIICKARIAQRWRGGWNMLLDEDYWSGRGPTAFTFKGDTILDAVMLAVAATEPKKTLA